MPLTDFGVSFDPSKQSQTGQGAPGRLRNPVQESVQTLNVRLPKVFGARAAVPRELMGGAGGMGQFGGGGSMIGQVLAMLAGIPQRPAAVSQQSPVSRQPPVTVQAPMMPGGAAGAPPASMMTPPPVSMMTPPASMYRPPVSPMTPVSMMTPPTPPPMMPPPPYDDNDNNRRDGGTSRGGYSGGGYSGGGSVAAPQPYLTAQQMTNVPGQPQPSALQFSQQSAYQPSSIFSAPLPVRVVVNSETGGGSYAPPPPQYSPPAPAYSGPLSPWEQSHGGVPYNPTTDYSQYG